MQKEGNMTRGTDGHTIDGMSLERIDKIIERIKTKVINQLHLAEYISIRGKIGKEAFRDTLYR
jgi:hypothetical protein